MSSSTDVLSPSELISRALRDALRPAPAGPLPPFRMLAFGGSEAGHYEPADFAAVLEEEDRYLSSDAAGPILRV